MKNDVRLLESKYGAHNYHPLPVVLVKGKGAHVWDENGKKYIDMMSAYSAVSHGHCHPDLVRVMKKQASTLTLTSRAYYNDQLGIFLKMLCGITGMDKALPMNTGAEAVETAIKAARRWGYNVKKIPDGKAEIIVAKNNFHGRTTTITSFSTESDYRAGFSPFTPGFVHVPFGDAKALERAITPHTCAFLVEPVQGEAGIIVPPKGWLKEVQAICKKHRVLLIVDEVQTGLGRTGKWFAFQHEITKPDGLILGKALGGGMLPVSAFLGSEELMCVFTPGSHGSTFGGNTLAAAIGIESLRILKRDKLPARSKMLGEFLQKKLAAIKSPLIKGVRGKGLLIGVEIIPSVPARLVCETLLKNGVLSKDTHGTVVRFAPPLIITKEQLLKAVSAFEKTLHQLEGDRSCPTP